MTTCEFACIMYYKICIIQAYEIADRFIFITSYLISIYTLKTISDVIWYHQINFPINEKAKFRRAFIKHVIQNRTFFNVSLRHKHY